MPTQVSTVMPHRMVLRDTGMGMGWARIEISADYLHYAGDAC